MGKDTKDEIDKICRLFDTDSKGVATVKDVMKVAKELGERLTMEEISEIVRRACQDESTMEITPEDFYLVMTKKTFPWVVLLASRTSVAHQLVVFNATRMFEI